MQDEHDAAETAVNDEEKLIGTEGGGDPPAIQQQPEVSTAQHNKMNSRKLTMLRSISLILLMAQNTTLVLLMRYSKTRSGPIYLSSVSVFVSEILKLIACLVVVTQQHNWNLNAALMEVNTLIISRPWETMKVAVPALIYTVQNNILFVAVSNLDAATFQVSYQLKIFTTAVLSVLMLSKKLSPLQWVALVLLFTGVSIVQVSNLSHSAAEPSSIANPTETATVARLTRSTDDESAHEQSYAVGITCVLVACFMSGYSGVYFEQILKGSDVSLWIRNIQLAGLSIPLAFVGSVIYDWNAIQKDGFFYGFDAVVWLIIFVLSFGGLLVAVVVKYADNILKGFATSGGVVLSVVMSYLLFDTTITGLFSVGAALVVAAVYIYSAYPPGPASKTALLPTSAVKR